MKDIINLSKLVRSTFIIFAIILLGQAGVSAADKPYETFGRYKVFYSVFNSSFIQPEIARLYNITRGKDQALVNIAVIHDDKEGGIAAKVEGSAANLMQQQRALKFVEIREKNAVYYLAPVRFTNEEVLNFSIEVKTKNNQRPYTVEFTKTLYVDS